MKDEMDSMTMDFEDIERRSIVRQRKTEKLFLQALTIGLDVLGDRIMVVLSLLLSAGLFAWGMMEPSTLRLFMAGAFASLVFLPILVVYYNREKGRD